MYVCISKVVITSQTLALSLMIAMCVTERTQQRMPAVSALEITLPVWAAMEFLSETLSRGNIIIIPR